MKFLPTIALVLFWPAVAAAQPTRYETGLRLQRFETAWDAQPDPIARKRTLPPLRSAISAFFSGRTAEAARGLDQARLALHSADPAPDAVRWAESLMVRPASRLIDAASTDLAVELRPFYDTNLPVPAGAVLRLSLGQSRSESPIAALPLSVKVPLNHPPEGDERLRAEVIVPGQPPVTTEHVVSVERDRDVRIKKLRAGLVDGEPTTDRLTLRALVRQLGELANGATLETGMPAARLLAEAEGLAKALTLNQPFYGPHRTGQFWLSIPTNGTPAPVRLLVPESARSGRPLPLVVALHGAGGSENMFFEAYGHGRLVDLCQERGWMLVATRSDLLHGPPVEQVIAELGRLYPLAANRVFVMGHSMGAAQTIAAVQQPQSRFAAAAALGGGGAVTRPNALEHLPIFIGCGTEDFALGGARTLDRALRKAGAAKVTFREYPDIEHIVVVQAALDDVMAFFDAAAKEGHSVSEPFEAGTFPAAVTPGAAATLPYRLLKPQATEFDKKYPLVIFLHGAGERGTDNLAQLKHVVRTFAEPAVREKYPCYVFAPQCPPNQRWVEVDWDSPVSHTLPKEPSRPMADVLAMTDRLMAEQAIDPARIYVVGLSMGGFGTWDLVSRFPDRFAAAVPICGGADESLAGRLTRLPIWVFHGAKDPLVKPVRSRGMVEALRKAGSTAVKFTEFPDVAHDAWTPAFGDPELLPWLFAQRK